MAAKDKTFEDGDLVAAGFVRRVFGIKGELAVEWNNGSCPTGIGKEKIYLKKRDGKDLEGFTVLKDRAHKDCNIVLLKGLTSRTEAEKFRGSEIWIERGKLPELGKGEYYAYQLLEMRVETLQGEYLGEIVKIFSTGSNDVYVVKNGSEEIMIPAIEDVVKEVDLKNGIMRVELIEGLR